MTRITAILAAVSFLAPLAHAGDEWESDLSEKVAEVKELKREESTAPPPRQGQIREQISQNLGAIDEIADKRPRNVNAQKAVTDGFLDAGEPKRAERTSKRRVNLTPKDPDAWVQLSRVYYDQGDFKKSIGAANYARKLDPGNAAAMAMVKLAEGRSGAMKDPPKKLPDLGAEPTADDAPGPQPGPEPVGKDLRPGLAEASALLEKDPGAALKAAEAVIVADPSDAGAHLVAAEAKLKLGDVKGAGLEAELVQKLGGDKGKALNVAAKAQLAAGNYAAAAREANKALELDPRDRQALLTRAAARIRAGEADAALAELKKAFEAGDVPKYDYDKLVELAQAGGPADIEPAMSQEEPKTRRPWLLLAMVAGAGLLGVGFLSSRRSSN